MNEPKKTRHRKKLLNLRLLEGLLLQRKASPESIYEWINEQYGTNPKPRISLKVLQEIFRGSRQPQAASVELIADFFGADAASLELGFSVRRFVSPKIWRAYKTVVKQFLPNGQFHNVSNSVDLTTDIKTLVLDEFSDSKFHPHEFSSLFAMLDGSYIIRTSDKKYFRLPQPLNGDRFYFGILNTILDASLAEKTWRHENVPNIQHNISRIAEFDEPETFFASQKDLVIAMTKANINVDRWVEEICGLIQPTFDEVSLDASQFQKTKANLMEPLKSLYSAVSSQPINTKLARNFMGRYLDALRRIKGVDSA